MKMYSREDLMNVKNIGDEEADDGDEDDNDDGDKIPSNLVQSNFHIWFLFGTVFHIQLLKVLI